LKIEDTVNAIGGIAVIAEDTKKRNWNSFVDAIAKSKIKEPGAAKFGLLFEKNSKYIALQTTKRQKGRELFCVVRRQRELQLLLLFGKEQQISPIEDWKESPFEISFLLFKRFGYLGLRIKNHYGD
jgi:hypothetical protein